MRDKFTGYERDNETNLDYAQARYFASSQGRFSSPDPLMASATVSDPQTWNRYAYVANNPLVYTDPSGLSRQPGGRNISNWNGAMATSEATDGISAWPEPIEGELSNELEGQGDQSPSSPTQSQTPTSVSMTVPEPNTMVNIPIPGNEFLTGVGTIIELTPLDQNGNPIPDITVLESVTPSTTIQNPNFVTFPGGVVTDIVARGAHTTAPLTLQQAGDIIVPILSTPTTISQTHSVLMKSPTSSVWALAVHQRTLTNVDSQGNLRPFINAQTMRTVNNFTITVTKVDVVQIPMVRCLRVF